MELLNTIALYTGYIALGGIAFIALLFAFDYHNCNRLFMFKVFGFGIIKAKCSENIRTLNEARETEGKQWFVTAPRWFNAIWNIGGIK